MFDFLQNEYSAEKKENNGKRHARGRKYNLRWAGCSDLSVKGFVECWCGPLLLGSTACLHYATRMRFPVVVTDSDIAPR
jgi:hypothetical protein